MKKSKDDNNSDAKKEEQEALRQREINRESARVFKFYKAAQPFRDREPRIKRWEALSELTKLRGSLKFDEAKAYCDEAMQKLKEQILEEEQANDDRD